MELTKNTIIKVKDKTKGRNNYSECRRNYTAKVIKEYPNFYLILNEKGYKECINKIFLKTGDIKVMEG
ncbi:hypothetical protein D2962_09565 [Biomaibacter acetigenes]|uniref:Uncharacterized protein n=1 Tax=Biomaibacter acetigenes TaxID=2316383 RepID=A0A3G2R7N5_9FIRM|nr:hypothetical protein D2962_09565 [Biomaibacter acetigenes]